MRVDRLEIPGTHNLRDLGGRPVADGGRIRAGVLFRGDAPVDLGEDGQHGIDALGLRTVIDLRTTIERRNDPTALAGRDLHLPLLDDAELRVVRPLDELYAALLAERAGRIAEIAQALAAPEALPALIHCAAGKDRTGIVTAVVLSAVGVPDEDVIDDYAATARFLTDAFRRRLARSAALAQIDEQQHAVLLGSPPSMMRALLGTLATRHGSAFDYLRDAGMSPAELRALRAGLVIPHVV